MFKNCNNNNIVNYTLSKEEKIYTDIKNKISRLLNVFYNKKYNKIFYKNIFGNFIKNSEKGKFFKSNKKNGDLHHKGYVGGINYYINVEKKRRHIAKKVSLVENIYFDTVVEKKRRIRNFQNRFKHYIKSKQKKKIIFGKKWFKKYNAIGFAKTHKVKEFKKKEGITVFDKKKKENVIREKLSKRDGEMKKRKITREGEIRMRQYRVEKKIIDSEGVQDHYEKIIDMYNQANRNSFIKLIDPDDQDQFTSKGNQPERRYLDIKRKSFKDKTIEIKKKKLLEKVSAFNSKVKAYSKQILKKKKSINKKKSIKKKIIKSKINKFKNKKIDILAVLALKKSKKFKKKKVKKVSVVDKKHKQRKTHYMNIIEKHKKKFKNKISIRESKKRKSNNFKKKK